MTEDAVVVALIALAGIVAFGFGLREIRRSKEGDR